MFNSTKSLIRAGVIIFGSTALFVASAASAAGVQKLGDSVARHNVVGVSVGNGVTQSKPIANGAVGSGAKAPLVGVGALSGNPGHGGRLATVSALNTNRLVGADLGPQGPKSRGGVALTNPRGEPILSGKKGSGPKGDFSHELTINPAKLRGH